MEDFPKCGCNESGPGPGWRGRPRPLTSPPRSAQVQGTWPILSARTRKRKILEIWTRDSRLKKWVSRLKKWVSRLIKLASGLCERLCVEAGA